MFSDTEKEKLINDNNTQLNMYQNELMQTCLESKEKAISEALKIASSLNVELNKTSV